MILFTSVTKFMYRIKIKYYNLPKKKKKTYEIINFLTGYIKYIIN